MMLKLSGLLGWRNGSGTVHGPDPAGANSLVCPNTLDLVLEAIKAATTPPPPPNFWTCGEPHGSSTQFSMPYLAHGPQIVYDCCIAFKFCMHQETKSQLKKERLTDSNVLTPCGKIYFSPCKY